MTYTNNFANLQHPKFRDGDIYAAANFGTTTFIMFIQDWGEIYAQIQLTWKKNGYGRPTTIFPMFFPGATTTTVYTVGKTMP